jgi:hypothetical protein
MALPASGQISLANIQTEFGGSNPISLSEYYRNGAYVTSNNMGVPTSGSVSLSNYYNAVRQFAFSIASSYTTTQDLRTLALSAGWDGAASVVATINSGVVLRGAIGGGGGGGASVVPYGSNGLAGSAGSTGLTVSGSFPGGVSLNNNGTVYGGGGGGFNYLTTQARIDMFLATTMRSAPTLTISSASHFSVEYGNGAIVCTAISLDQPSTKVVSLNCNVSSGLVQGQGVHLNGAGTSAARLNLSAEL